MKPSDVGAAIYARLKQDYLEKIPYGSEFAILEDKDPVMRERGVREDHVAFRTFYCDTGELPRGIESVERIFRACGWKRGKDENGEDCRYDFPAMHLRAIHLEFPEDRPDLPKMFISEMIVEELGPEDAKLVEDDLKDTKDPITDEDRRLMARLENGEEVEEAEAEAFIAHAYKALTRPWQPPHRRTVSLANGFSQYVPWTLLNGGLNHIAYLTKNLEETAKAHREAGRELLPNIMSDKEGTLKQTSLRSPMFEFQVTDEGSGEGQGASSSEGGGLLSLEVREDDGTIGKILWTGPFAELVERPLQANGSRRENFLPGNAAHIFAATRNRAVGAET